MQVCDVEQVCAWVRAHWDKEDADATERDLRALSLHPRFETPVIAVQGHVKDSEDMCRQVDMLLRLDEECDAFELSHAERIFGMEILAFE